jgi:hypothetical protein
MILVLLVERLYEELYEELINFILMPISQVL